MSQRVLVCFGLVAVIFLFSDVARTDAAVAKPAAAVQHVEVRSFARYMGLKLVWIKPHKKLKLKSPWTDIVLEEGSREIVFNGVNVYIGDPIVEDHGHLYFNKTDVDAFFLPLLRPQDLKPIGPIRKICIDAGHGGKDTGTRNTRLHLMEKTFTLDVAKRLRRLLRARGFQVVMTRHNDTFIPLDERPHIADKTHCDLFISIHFNAAGDKAVHGTETYILTPQYQRSTSSEKPYPEDNIALPSNRLDGWNAVYGFNFQQDILKSLHSFDRGLKRARFAVLKTLDCPGLLVEGAYLSNPRGARNLSHASYREKLARAYADGIEDFARTVKRIRERNRK